MSALGEQLSDTPVLTLHNTISVAILQTYSHCLFILPSPIFNKYLCRTDLSFDSHRTQITSGYHLFFEFHKCIYSCVSLLSISENNFSFNIAHK